MFKIKTLFSFGLLAAVAMPVLTSCNDDWKEEQYANYISFKAPLDGSGAAVGVTTVYVPYTRRDADNNAVYGREGVSHYNLPVIVAGSQPSETSFNVNIAHSDTLDILNVERFGHRTEIYYHDMWDFAEVPPTIFIPKGEDVALLNIKLDFTKNGGIDLIDRYVLPLTVAPGAGYERNPRKNYATAMLRILPYTDFSGIYQAQNLLYDLVNADGTTSGDATGMETVQLYTCGEHKTFFYAGTNTERSLLRKNFRIYADFIPDENFPTEGTIVLSVDPNENPELNFRQEGIATYKIVDAADPVMTYVTRRTLIIRDIEYYYTDTKSALGSAITYQIKGNMTMERKLNTQMPEEDQIMWD